MFYQAIKLSKALYKIQKVQLKYYRCGKIERSVTKQNIVNSEQAAKKTMSDALAQTKLNSPYGELLFHSDRFFLKPFLGMVVVVADDKCHKLIEVQQHLSVVAQGHQVLHSEHLDVTDAIATAKRLYYSRVSQEITAYYEFQRQYLPEVTCEQFILHCAKKVIEADLEWVASNNLVAA